MNCLQSLKRFYQQCRQTFFFSRSSLSWADDLTVTVLLEITWTTHWFNVRASRTPPVSFTSIERTKSIKIKPGCSKRSPLLQLACLVHPSAISFFRVHTILHDILGFDTIITRYTRYFKSVKNCGFFLKACSGDSRQLAKKRVNYIFLGTYPFQWVITYRGYILTFCATFI